MISLYKRTTSYRVCVDEGEVREYDYATWRAASKAFRAAGRRRVPEVVLFEITTTTNPQNPRRITRVVCRYRAEDER